MAHMANLVSDNASGWKTSSSNTEGMECPEALIKAINKNDVRGVYSFSTHANVNLKRKGVGDTPICAAWIASSTWGADVDMVRVLFGKGSRLDFGLGSGWQRTKKNKDGQAVTCFEDMSHEERQQHYADRLNYYKTIPSYQRTDGTRGLESFYMDLKKWDKGDIQDLQDTVLREVVQRRKLDPAFGEPKFEPSEGRPMPKEWEAFANKINETWSDVASEVGDHSSHSDSHSEGSAEVVKPDDLAKPLTLNEQVDAIIDRSGLSTIVGLQKVKETIKQLARDVLLEQLRRLRGVGQALPREPMHMVFLGNPGTGKTSIARLLARILKDAGIIKRDALVEVQREDLVGQHIGQSEHRTGEIVNAAKGGVLFVDEAYRLYSVSQKDYGIKALETLMKEMLSGDPVMIFAGYPQNMQEFLDMNPGMRRRISFYFNFDDYSPEDLSLMFASRVKKLEYKLAKDITNSWIAEAITSSVPKDMLSKVNAGIVDQLFARARFELNGRLTGLEDSAELVTFSKDDLETALKTIAANFKGGIVEKPENESEKNKEQDCD
eukprot:TRINITY_DN52889_c0_g1_i1.p1 TRINITY_DN52889_c0_g1~~TRINITY_DN52889_c0_g1_i1.p1  ORF type:complete len:549 (-),score=47.61 TRINITY_DN52889_c0_g1_i1:27-1673(-)